MDGGRTFDGGADLAGLLVKLWAFPLNVKVSLDGHGCR